MDPSNADAAPSAGKAARRIKDAAGAAIDSGKTMARDRVGTGVDGVKAAGESTASALRRAADDLAGEHRFIGEGLRKSAEAVDRITHSLAGGDLNHAMGQVGAFARRQPIVFIGAGVALGFLLSRVGKTAIERASDLDDDEVAAFGEPLDPSPGY